VVPEKGMKVSATKVVEVPETVITQEKTLTGTMPPLPPVDLPLLIVLVKHIPSPTPAQPELAANKLPKTGTVLMGFLGPAFTGASFGMHLLRRA
jgi:hypothetical protein